MGPRFLVMVLVCMHLSGAAFFDCIAMWSGDPALLSAAGLAEMPLW